MFFLFYLFGILILVCVSCKRKAARAMLWPNEKTLSEGSCVMRIRRLTAWFCALVLLAVLSAPLCSAQKPEDAYVSTIYNETSGLPTGEANTVLQTGDGYLWIGSYGGLIRYDGSSFRNFSREGALTSASIRSLYEDSVGRLWIGTNDAGVFVYENGAFQSIPCTEEHSFLCIRDFTEGLDRAVYVASNSGMGVIRDGELMPCSGEGLEGETVYSLGRDRFGRIWGAMDYGRCVVIEDDALVGQISSSAVFGDGEDIYCLTSDRAGILYFGSDGTSFAKAVLVDREIGGAHMFVTRYTTPNTALHNRICVSDSGDILLSGQRGFAWVDDDGVLREFDESSGAVALNWAEMDYEGNLWLASSNEGVIKLNLGSFTSPNHRAGLDGLAVNAVAEAGGLFYLATDRGLLAFSEDWQPVRNRLTERLNGVRVRCALGDRAGRIWCASYTDDTVICYDAAQDEMICFGQADGLAGSRGRVLLELSDGAMAVGLQEGLSVIRDGAVAESYGKEDGMDVPSILCLAESTNGTILAGSDGGGIYMVKNGVVNNYGFDAGLNEGVVLRMLRDRERGGWFVSAGSSLYYWEAGTFRRLDNFRKEAGSIFDMYFRDGKLWLLQNSGVLAVDKKQLVSGEEAHAVLYGTNHGLTGSLNANTWHYLSPDGRLYLATRAGVSVFAFHGVENRLPKVTINSVRVDTERYDNPSELTLNSDAQRVTVDFAALSYSGTGDLRVAYYLEGFEEEETELEGALSDTVSYTNLPGGDYVFHLRVYHAEDPQEANDCRMDIHKDKKLYEYPLFWIVGTALLIIVVACAVWMYSHAKVEKMRRRQKEYQQIVEQSLQTFANTIDAKDPYTNGHSARVAWYSREIARRMGLSKQEQERIYYVALMHDIGKIGVPDHILNKNGRLTAEERKIIQMHPSVGGDILRNFTALDGIAEGARYHHERYDGRGYCTGLAGVEIPLVARIIGVADSYDAMSSDRCYRKALPQDVVAEELRKGSGTQFDPTIVPVMLDMMRDGVAPLWLPEEDATQQDAPDEH